MKNFICLFLLLSVYFLEKNTASGMVMSDSNLDDHNKNYTNLFQKGFGEQFQSSDSKFQFDAGNPDIHARIERPCEIYDSFCIRRFFAEHSKCRISAEPVPEPLFRAQCTLFTPSQNLSLNGRDLAYNGIRTGKVEEFYINKATDNLVITLGFDFVSMFGYFSLKFYRTGREPAITQDYGGFGYGKMSITVVIPHLNDLRLEKADISTFLYNPGHLYIGYPGLVPSDGALQDMVTSFTGNLRSNQQEHLLTEGMFYASTFIQYNICDFGLKVL